jgi:hypothetical protein
MRTRFRTTVAVVLLFALDGCGNDSEVTGSDDRLLTYEEMVEEYRAKVSEYPFPLPEGVSFPERPREPDEPTLYEPGNGIVQADSYWECAWIREWLLHRTEEPGRAEAAMAWLDRSVETEFRQRFVVSDPAIWTEEILGRAKLGDPTHLREYYDSSCASREGLGRVG